MITTDQVRRLALALPETEEHDHWGHPGYRVGENIFAVLWPQERIAMLKLSREDQHALLSVDPYTFTVDQWAEQGWTKILLKNVTRNEFEEQLELAWRQFATKDAIKALEAKRRF